MDLIARLVAVIALMAACLALSASVYAQASSTGNASTFDPVAATDAYLSRLTPEQKARSNAYFEGKYWLLFWNVLAALVVATLLLETRLSAHMRNLTNA